MNFEGWDHNLEYRKIELELNERRALRDSQKEQRLIATDDAGNPTLRFVAFMILSATITGIVILIGLFLLWWQLGILQ